MKRLAFCLLLSTFRAYAAEPTPPSPASWTARVRLLTDEKRVELHRFADDSLVCRAPCARAAMLAVTWLVAAGGLFSDLIVNSDTDNHPASHGGLVVGALGGALIIGGIALLVSAHSTRFEIER
jgi:hypothetical protein